MNTRLNSSWTGRAPRTMRDAFNPYTDDVVYPMPEPRGRHVQDWLIYALAVVALIVIGVIL